MKTGRCLKTVKLLEAHAAVITTEREHIPCKIAWPLQSICDLQGVF